MICVYCSSDIEEDSFYCDQCGKELFICPTCGKPGKGKRCVEDGGKLYSPAQQSASPAEMGSPNKSIVPVSVFDPVSPLSLPPTISNDDSSVPILRLINDHLSINLKLNNGDIIGRTKGNHIDIFGQFSQVSSQHAQFLFDAKKGWVVKDLGSTNGLAVNTSPNWQNIPKLKPQTPQTLNDNTFLLIANIEFQVQIISPSTAALQPAAQLGQTGTQRL